MVRLLDGARLSALAMCATLAAQSSAAGPLASDAVVNAMGDPLSQEHYSATTSLIRSPDGVACVVSQTIDIETSAYTDEATGAAVPFDEVIRSRATSAQFIGAAAAPVTFRYQFKYTVHPDYPATLALPDRVIDIADLVEGSGDSVLIDDPADVAAIRRALERGETLAIEAHSLDTERHVVDALTPVDFALFDTCATLRPALSETFRGDVTNAVSAEFVATPDPALRADAEGARICGGLAGEEIYRATLIRNSGFFAQTAALYATFDEDGALSAVHVPGVFEASRARSNAFDAQVSRAANANNPMRAAAVSGCLGSMPAGLCLYPGGTAAAPTTILAPCFGALANADLFDGAQFLVSDADTLGAELAAAEALTEAAFGGPVGLVPTPLGSFARNGGGGGGSGGGGSGGSGGGSGGSGGGSGGGDDPTTRVSSIPAPAPFLLLIAAAGAILLLRSHAGRSA